MARKRASMREGPLAELFRATEAAQRQSDQDAGGDSVERLALDETVEYAPDFASSQEAPQPEEELRPAEAESKPTRHLESVEAVVVDLPPAPVAPAAPVAPPAEESERQRLRPELWDAAPEPPILHAVPRPDSGTYVAVIKVVGVGGAGLNAVNRMIDAGLSQVEFLAVNTDIQQLQFSDAPLKIHIGRELTEGLGSGADPSVGRSAAEESHDEIKQALRGVRHGLRNGG